jgi:uncharacterized protein DUF3800
LTNEITDKPHKFLCDLLSVLLPQDRGHAVLMLAFFDESSTADHEPSMVVAGYVFTPESYRQFDLDWAAALARAGVPYWHTVRSMGRPSGPFTGKTVAEVDALAVELRAAIHAYSAFGVGVSVTVREFDAMAPAGWHVKYGGAYTICLQWCLEGIAMWADNNRVEGPFAYFFEAGDSHEDEALDRMNLVYKLPAKRAGYRHASHTFADKKCHRGLQAADMFAWHYARLYNRSVLGGQRVREDTRALLTGAPPERHKAYRLQGESMRRWFNNHGSPEATGEL